MVVVDRIGYLEVAAMGFIGIIGALIVLVATEFPKIFWMIRVISQCPKVLWLHL